MNKYISLFLVAGMALFVAPANAYFHDMDTEVTTVTSTELDSTQESDDGSATLTTTSTDSSTITNVTTTDSGGTEETSTSSDDKSSNWIRTSQPWPDEDDSDESSLPGIEHEDIGITELPEETEAAEAQYNETDFDLVTRLVEAGGVFLKFEGVEGESKSDSEGDPDRPLVEGRVYSEVHIDGATVRGWDPVQKEELEGKEIDVSEADTGVELAILAAQAANSDRNMEEVSLYFNKIEAKYAVPFKLFGFINTRLNSDVVVEFTGGEEIYTDEFGRVKVKFPWYHFLGRKSAGESEIAAAYEESVKEGGENVRTHTLMARSARALHAISTVMREIHDPGITELE